MMLAAAIVTRRCAVVSFAVAEVVVTTEATLVAETGGVQTQLPLLEGCKPPALHTENPPLPSQPKL